MMAPLPSLVRDDFTPFGRGARTTYLVLSMN
jgi:hypothetical protein